MIKNVMNEFGTYILDYIINYVIHNTYTVQNTRVN